MRRQNGTRCALLKVLGGSLLVAVALTAHAQGTPEVRGLPPAPTPTALYPGAGSAASYTSSSGVALYAAQSLYLPIQTQMSHGDANARAGQSPETALSARVSIRNTDPRASLRVTSARYYNTEGQLLRDFLPKPQTLPPLGTYEIQAPRSGGPGSSFIIEWNAERPINPPLVEALHSDGRSLYFATSARPIHSQ